jgi:hypothetical protein
MTWGGLVGLWLGFMVVSGGLSTPSPLATTLHVAASTAFLLASLLRLKDGFPNRLSLLGWALLFAAFIYVVVQLIPLPAATWQGLPGRALIRDTLLLTGPELPALPLSLTPYDTQSTILAMVPVFAGFMAALSMKPRDFLAFSLALTCWVVLSVFVGFLQKTGRAPDFLYLYAPPGTRAASGFFGNRNFLGALIFASLPFLAVVASAVQRRFSTRPILVLLFILIYMGILLSGLAVIGSRGGVLLSMPAVFLTLLFVYKSPVDISRIKRSGFATFAVLAAIMVISQSSMIGILRLVETDPLQDYRNTILDVSLATARGFWPLGSGFGSFVNVYQMYEGPAEIVDRYINTAHNDWLQLIIEGGAVAAFFCLCFLVLFATGVFRTIRHNRGADVHATAMRASAVTIALLAAHGLADFGLRTPALVSLLAVAAGFLCLSGRVENRPWKAAPANRQHELDPEPAPSRAARREPGKPYFKVPDQK